MPIYEFRCTKCQNAFEIILKRDDVQPTVCPKCNGRTEKLPPTGTSFKFNCTGSSKDYKAIEAQKKRKILSS